MTNPLIDAPRRLYRGLARLRDETAAIAAVEFCLIAPILLALMLGGIELARYVNTTRQITNLADSLGTLLSERTTALNYYDAAYVFNSTMVTFPLVLSDSVLKNIPWQYDIAVTLSSVSFTPTVSGCTSGCTYTAKVDWSINSPIAGARSCTVAPTAAADTAVPTLTTLPTDVYAAGSIVIADIVFTYVPGFGSAFVPTTKISRSAYLQPRYLSKIGYTVISGDPGYKPC